jgi:hypothetical protein
MTMWTGEEGAAAAAAEERSARVEAMRDGTRKEKATRWCGAIEMDVNDDSVAPWKVDDGMDDCGCVDEDGGGGCGAELGMNDVTTATGCAISRRSARILWEIQRTSLLLQRRAVAGKRAKRNMAEGQVNVCTC